MRHLAPEKDVGRHVEVIGQRQVLIDGLDAERLRRPRTVRRGPGGFERDRAAIPGDCARHDLDQSGLAGGVVAHQSVHLPRVDLDARVGQRLHAAVALADIPHFQCRGVSFRS